MAYRVYRIDPGEAPLRVGLDSSRAIERLHVVSDVAINRYTILQDLAVAAPASGGQDIADTVNFSAYLRGQPYPNSGGPNAPPATMTVRDHHVQLIESNPYECIIAVEYRTPASVTSGAAQTFNTVRQFETSRIINIPIWKQLQSGIGGGANTWERLKDHPLRKHQTVVIVPRRFEFGGVGQGVPYNTVEGLRGQLYTLNLVDADFGNRKYLMTGYSTSVIPGSNIELVHFRFLQEQATAMFTPAPAYLPIPAIPPFAEINVSLAFGDPVYEIVTADFPDGGEFNPIGSAP